MITHNFEEFVTAAIEKITAEGSAELAIALATMSYQVREDSETPVNATRLVTSDEIDGPNERDCLLDIVENEIIHHTAPCWLVVDRHYFVGWDRRRQRKRATKLVPNDVDKVCCISDGKTLMVFWNEEVTPWYEQDRPLYAGPEADENTDLAAACAILEETEEDLSNIHALPEDADLEELGLSM